MKKSRKIRSDSFELVALKHLYFMQQCWKSDFMLYMRVLYKNANTPARVYKKLIEDGYVDELNVPLASRRGSAETAKAVSVTRQGRNALSDIAGDKYVEKFGITFADRYRTNDPKALDIRYSENRAYNMYVIAGAAAKPEEKPSLYHLYFMLLPDTRSEKADYDVRKNDEKYRDDMTAEDIRRMLDDTGVYYTITEVRRFVRLVASANTDDDVDEDIPAGGADNIYQTRCRGLYFSRTNCTLAYVAQPHNNKRIQIRIANEKRLIDLLSGYLSGITDIFRSDIQTGYTGGVDAVVIAETEALVCRMSRQPAITTKRLTSPSLLAGGQTLFGRLYAVPMSISGAGQLDYICHTSEEQWAEESRQLFQSSDRFHLYDNSAGDSGKYMAAEVRDAEGSRNIRKAIYMPVYEMNELNRMQTYQDDVAVVTYPDMIDTMAKCICRDTHYYDAGTMQPVTDVMIYSHSGEPAGINAVRQIAADLGYDADKLLDAKAVKEFNAEVAKSESTASFWNKVCRNPEEAERLAEIITSGQKKADNTAAQKQYRRRKHSTITLSAEENVIEAIRAAARYKGVSITKYVLNHVLDAAISDAEEQRAKVRQDRLYNKNNL